MSSVAQRIALGGIPVLLLSLSGCQNWNWRWWEKTAPEQQPLGSMVPEEGEPISSGEPSAKIQTSAELAADERQAQPKDRYAPSPPEDHVHVLQAGESLYGLARKYYGDQQQWRRIYQANRNRISDPSKVKVGMKLIIP